MYRAKEAGANRRFDDTATVPASSVVGGSAWSGPDEHAAPISKIASRGSAIALRIGESFSLQ
jgi:hypothetical protein